MSHPQPGRDYSDKHNQETDKDYKRRTSSAHKALHNKMSKPKRTISDLKKMISQPASKEWFKKWGHK